MEIIRHKRTPVKKKIFSRHKWLREMHLKMWGSLIKVFNKKAAKCLMFTIFFIPTKNHIKGV